MMQLYKKGLLFLFLGISVFIMKKDIVEAKNMKNFYDKQKLNKMNEYLQPPAKVENLKFIDADNETAKIIWTASVGATDYKIEYNGKFYYTKQTYFKVPIEDESYSNHAIVYAERRNSETGYIESSAGTRINNLSKLTRKIDNKNFGIKEMAEYSKIYFFDIDGYGHGWELEGKTVKGKKQTFKQTLSYNSQAVVKLKNYNKMYKYRVRTYIINSDGKKIYGNWSEYKYFCNTNPKKTKYAVNNKKIKLSWQPLTGVSKIKIQISRKEKTGYKTCATIPGNKRSYTITKYGKTKIKKNKSYYVRILYQYKKGNKTYNSEIVDKAKIKIDN